MKFWEHYNINYSQTKSIRELVCKHDIVHPFVNKSPAIQLKPRLDCDRWKTHRKVCSVSILVHQFDSKLKMLPFSMYDIETGY